LYYHYVLLLMVSSKHIQQMFMCFFANHIMKFDLAVKIICKMASISALGLFGYTACYRLFRKAERCSSFQGVIYLVQSDNVLTPLTSIRIFLFYKNIFSNNVLKLYMRLTCFVTTDIFIEKHSFLLISYRMSGTTV